MFDKRKCAKCKYSMKLSGGGRSDVESYTLGCDYCGVSGNTCLQIDRATNKVIDTRGDNPKKCQLYKKKRGA